MNLVGKIFTVFIFVMSLVFMSLAVAVYATHKNWKTLVDNPQETATTENPLGYKQKLENAKVANQRLKDEKDKIETDLSDALTLKQADLTKAENKSIDLAGKLSELQEKYDELLLSQRAAVGAMKAAQTEAETLRAENVGLRAEIRTTEADRDAQFKEVVRLTDEIHQVVSEVKRLRAREKDLAVQYSEALEVLRFFGKTPVPTNYPGPPDVDGLVLATPGGGLVEISIGADDGLLKGHLLQIVRSGGGQGTYVGKVEVLKTDPDKSVCKVDPKYLKSPVQRGDRVYSRL